MPLKEIKPNIIPVGTLDPGRKLFDELIPLPNGTSYNSYIVIGSNRTALIDTSDPTKEKEFLENLKQTSIKTIDYVISNHAEQDHSGLIPKVLELYPNAKVVTNTKCKNMLKDLIQIKDDKFMEITDSQTLDLGGKTLEFIIAPWVHWPETMFTYLKEDKILFSCDFLGSHIASTKLFADTDPIVYTAAKRYYAEIMMPFRNNIKTNLERIKGLAIDFIAPSHGPVYNKPDFIINAYKDWVSDTLKNEVIIPYVSMHGSTKVIVDNLIFELKKRNITVKPINLSGVDIGELAIELVDAATVVIATPTVLAGAHPSALYAAVLANAIRPKCKFLSIVGSFGWGGKAVDQLASLIPNLKVEIIPPVLIKGYPKEQDLKLIEALADTILQKHKEISLI